MNFLTLSRGTYNKLIWHAEVHKLGQILKFCGGQFYLNSVSFSENLTNFEKICEKIYPLKSKSRSTKLRLKMMIVLIVQFKNRKRLRLSLDKIGVKFRKTNIVIWLGAGGIIM